MYYPKSQLKTNLYTNGGEYILSTTKQDYTGYYYETSSGTKYTGKTPQDGANILLTKPNQELNIIQNISNSNNPNYIEIQDDISGGGYLLNSPIRTLPLSNPTTPTQQDQNLGVFQRYFCKKNNELKYLEIDKPTHDKLQSQQQDIAWDLYTPISTLWYIKGDKEQTFKANKGLISLIEKDQKWYGFTQWFKDRFLQYYLES
jgi:hypothetical protein